jgi:hypothetical protein
MLIVRILVASLNCSVAACVYVGVDRVSFSFLLLDLHTPSVGVAKTFSGFALQTFGIHFGLLGICLRADCLGFLLFRLESSIACVLSDVCGATTVGVCASPPPKDQREDNNDDENDHNRDDEPNGLLGGHDEPFHLLGTSASR